MSNNLRAQIMQGGTYLVLRRASGILLNLLNIVVMTKFLGLDGYGLYTAAIVIFGYISGLSQMSVNVYLIRQSAAGEDDYHQTFSLCAVLSLAGITLGIAALLLITRVAAIDGLTPVLAAMFLALPVSLTMTTPAAILERNLNYQKLTVADLCGQFAFSVCGLSLVALGFGIWGIIIGWWAQQIVTAGLLFKSAAYRPRFYWNRTKAKAALAYGFSFSVSLWIWQARDLVNPLIVGHFAGAEGVGLVALTIRLAQALCFIKDATWRLSIAAFAQIQTDRAKLLSAVREGMFLQILALGPLLIAFNWLGWWILPKFFSADAARIMNLFPFVAIGFLINAAFNMHSAALYVLEKNKAVGVFHLVFVALFAVSAFVFVPQFGITGYGLAELAALPAYAVIYLATRSLVGNLSHSQNLLILAAFGGALLTLYLGWWAALGLFVLPFNRNIRHDVSKIIKVVAAQLNFKRYLKFVTN